MEISKEYLMSLVAILTIVFKLLNITVLPEQIEGFAYVLIQLIALVANLLKIKSTDNTNWFGAIKK